MEKVRKIQCNYLEVSSSQEHGTKPVCHSTTLGESEKKREWGRKSVKTVEC